MICTPIQSAITISTRNTVTASAPLNIAAMAQCAGGTAVRATAFAMFTV